MARTRFTVKEGISVADDNAVGGYPLIPVGSVIAFAGSAAPEGWLLCDGRSVGMLRTTYANLFAVIGTTYGSGDSSTTFNLPDMRSRMPIGAGAGTGLTARTLAVSGGAESVVIGTANLPTHVHAVDHNHASVDSGDNNVTHKHSVNPPNTASGDDSPGHTHAVDPPNTGSGNPNNSHYHGVSSGYHEHGYKIAATAAAGTNRNILTSTGTGDFTGGINPTYAGSTDWDANNHTHNTDVASFDTGGRSAFHKHDIDIAAFDSGNNDVSHKHAVDLPAFSGNSGDGGFTNTALALMNPFLPVNYIIKY